MSSERRGPTATPRPAHTKGPWRAHPDGTTVECGVEGVRRTLASLNSLPEQRANAALLAAAPDLLAALWELVERRDRACKQGGGNPDGTDGRYARARAALAKAGVP